MKNTKVTVVTVTYNAKDVLEETILSVLHQSYQNIDYIIIDGGSTDGTVDVIKQYDDKINYWISEPDEGIYFAMNKAIEKASGEFINFMNAGDTFADNETVEFIMGKVVNDTELIYGDHISNDTICSVKHRQTISRSMPCCHQSLFVKTNLMKDNPFDTSYMIVADYDFILKMYKKNKKFVYIQEPLSIYFAGGFSEHHRHRAEFETISLYIKYQIDIDEIINSRVYNNILRSNPLLKKQRTINSKLKIAIKELASIRFLTHPIQKIQCYKKLIKTYKKI